MELIYKDNQDGYLYDPIIKQYDTSFWKTTTGTPAMSSNVLRFTSAAAASFIQHIYAELEFVMTFPVAPVAAQAKIVGFKAPATNNFGGIYFEIADDVFKAVSIDDQGTSQSTTLTWSAYHTNATKFRIIWTPNLIRFLIADVVVATHTTRVPNQALPLRITNGNADNMDLTYIGVKRAASII